MDFFIYFHLYYYIKNAQYIIIVNIKKKCCQRITQKQKYMTNEDFLEFVDIKLGP